MRALLLAAGLGTRLRPITNSIPKCLVPIHGRPLIDYWLDLVFEGGVERALINTHYFSDTVDAHLAHSKWKDRFETVYEPELLGTGGTMVANADFFQGKPFILAHADNLTDVDVSALIAAHGGRPEDCAMTMLTFRTDDPSSCGIVELDEAGRVAAFHEKVPNPPGNVASGAVYVFEPEILEFAKALNKSFVDLSTEVIPHFVGRIFVYDHPGYHRDIGNPQSLEKAHAEFPVLERG